MTHFAEVSEGVMVHRHSAKDDVLAHVPDEDPTLMDKLRPKASP